MAVPASPIAVRRLDPANVKKLPDITRFFFNHAAFLSTGTIVVALLAIAALFVFPRKIWCIPVGLFIGIVCFAVTQLAGFAFQLPMVQIL